MVLFSKLLYSCVKALVLLQVFFDESRMQALRKEEIRHEFRNLLQTNLTIVSKKKKMS